MTDSIEVLIVEDDPRIAEIHRRFASKLEGFQVVATATTGEQATEWLEVMKPRLVLLDVYLPDTPGIELVKHIRSRHMDTDIIMITAASEIDVVRQALHGGVFDFIVKPLTFDRFRQSLEAYRRRLEELQAARGSLSREQIQALWNPASVDGSANPEAEVPKGIDPITLEKVVSHVAELGGEGVTAESLSRAAGISRSTARRYLEYLVSRKQLIAKLEYGTIGRPERRYVPRP